MAYGVCFYNHEPIEWLKEYGGQIMEFISKGAAEAQLSDFCSGNNGKDEGAEVRQFPGD